MAVLVLDSVLLLLAWAWTGRVAALLWGLACGAGALGVLAYWRRHRRNLRELTEDLAARREDLQAIQEAIRRAPPQ